MYVHIHLYSYLHVGNNPARPGPSNRLWASKLTIAYQGSQALSLQGTSARVQSLGPQKPLEETALATDMIN
jgi:hypothetical protein